MSKLKVIAKVCKEFGENTSILGIKVHISAYFIHLIIFCKGLGNAAKAKTKTRAAAWIVIFSVCAAFTIEGLYSTITDILGHPYVTTTDITFQSKVDN